MQQAEEMESDQDQGSRICRGFGEAGCKREGGLFRWVGSGTSP